MLEHHVLTLDGVTLDLAFTLDAVNRATAVLHAGGGTADDQRGGTVWAAAFLARKTEHRRLSMIASTRGSSGYWLGALIVQGSFLFPHGVGDAVAKPQGPSHRSAAKAVERGLEDWVHIASVVVDRRDSEDQVEDLFQYEIVTDLVTAPRGREQWTAGR